MSTSLCSMALSTERNHMSIYTCSDHTAHTSDTAAAAARQQEHFTSSRTSLHYAATFAKSTLLCGCFTCYAQAVAQAITLAETELYRSA
jgi:hypothetical protein